MGYMLPRVIAVHQRQINGGAGAQAHLGVASAALRMMIGAGDSASGRQADGSVSNVSQDARRVSAPAALKHRLAEV
jgi:hypothetical protein